MAKLYRYPNRDVDNYGWVNESNGEVLWSHINEPVDAQNDLTAAVHSSTVENGRVTFGFTPLPDGPFLVISQVEINIWMISHLDAPGPTLADAFIVVDGVDYKFLELEAIPVPTTSNYIPPKKYTEVYPINPATEMPWTREEVNALTAGVIAYSTILGDFIGISVSTPNIGIALEFTTVVPHGLNVGDIVEITNHTIVGHPEVNAEWTIADLPGSDPSKFTVQSGGTVYDLAVGGTGGAVQKISTTGVGGLAITEMALPVEYTPVPVQGEAAREILTRYLIEAQTPQKTLPFTGPLSFLNDEILDPVDVSLDSAPTVDGLGWTFSGINRRIHEVQSQILDLDSLTVTNELQDIRLRLLTFLDTGIVRFSSTADANGIARLNVDREYTRAGGAYVRDPGGSVRLISPNFEIYGEKGMLFERPSTNYMRRSSFKTAFGVGDGVTRVGNGTNGGSITNDLTDILFDPTSTGIPRSCKIIAGTPVADIYWRKNCSDLPAGPITVSIWRKDLDDAQPLFFRLTLTSNGYFWNNTTGAWQAGDIWNTMTGSETIDAFVSKTMTVSAADNIRVEVGVTAASGVAGQVNWIYHIQTEPLTFATSPIVVDSNTDDVSRNAGSLSVGNNAELRSWRTSEGCGFFRFTPAWNSSDVASYSFIFLSTFWDANNYQAIQYIGSSGQLQFVRRANGVTTTAYKAVTFTRGETYEIMFLWTGNDRVLGLPNYTAAIFVDGNRGTDAVGDASPTETESADMLIGGNGTYFADGEMSTILIFVQPLTTEELLQLPL